MKKNFILIFVFLLLVPAVFAQTVAVRGVVKDNFGELLIGVNVIYQQGKGAVTDLNGEYHLDLTPGEYKLTVSYVGFVSQEKSITVTDKNLYIDFSLSPVTLSEVEVVGDVARTRETPIAFSNVSPVQLEEQLASQDIPLILNATPGVYATAAGGGDGDARINIRGFNQRNVAVMLDGIPVNDMENGWVYWSNWFGLDAVMRYTQVQRGLGASKLAIPSVGGTINIATKGIDNKRNISIKQEVGNNGFLRTTLGMTTGRMKHGWGITFAGSYKQGNGWVDQTWTKGWFYYLKVEKQFKKHTLSLSAMGAPQEHGQRSYKRYIATFDTAYARSVGTSRDFIDNLVATGQAVNRGLRYNPNWGYLSKAYITDTDTVYPNAEPFSTVSNFYHKPLFSLRDFWSVNERLYISNILYLSIGTGGSNSYSSSAFGNDTVHWQQELQKDYDINMNIAAPYRNTTKYSSTIMRNGMNNHFWLGLLSTFDYSASKAITISGGLDMRTYRGEHYREVADLFGGNYTLDSGNKNESTSTKKYVGDKIGYYNDALINWGGLFAQIKYINGSWSVFGNVTASLSGYKRIDYFITHDPGESSNKTPWKYLPGFTVKGGANYNLNENMNIFMNLGFISKAQRFNNVYDRGNELFRDIKNEQVRAAELGYSFVKSKFTLNINAYYTSWLNKPADRAMRISIDGEFHSVNINDMNARHMGIEFEFAWKIVDNLTLESLLSLGDWRWTSADTARVYDDNGQEIKEEARYFDARGLYVGDAAQFQNRESLRWEIIRGLYLSGSFTWFGKHYAEFNPMDYDPDRYPDSFDDDGNPIQSWKIPNYYVIDFHAGYSWWIKKVGFQVRGNLINALNNKFITDAQNNDPFLTHSSTFDANSAGVFMGMGRRFTLSLRINF